MTTPEERKLEFEARADAHVMYGYAKEPARQWTPADLVRPERVATQGDLKLWDGVTLPGQERSL